MKTFTDKATTAIATGIMIWFVGGLFVTASGAAKGPSFKTDNALEHVLKGAGQAHASIINGLANPNYTYISSESTGNHCEANEKYLTKAANDALRSSYPGAKILKVGTTMIADPNPSTTTMGGEVVASCTTNIYANIGGEYSVDWNVEIVEQQYFVVTAPLLTSVQKSAIKELEEFGSGFDQ